MVGAPRCGTTWLYQNLRDHPAVFLSRYKDVGLFCPDVIYRVRDVHAVGRDAEAFDRLFADAPQGATVGSSCTEDLYSGVAASRIQAMNPKARIIVQLRDPVEAMYSMWSLRTSLGNEHRTFAEALADEDAEIVPPDQTVRDLHWYLRLYRYGEQLPRFLDRFEPENIHVMIFEDMVRDPAAAYRGVLDFIGVEPSPLARATAANPNAVVRNRTAARLVFASSTVAAAKRIVPRRFHDRARRVAEDVNERLRRPTTRPPMDAELRATLVERSRPDVRQAGDLIGRDLETLWFGPGRRQR